MEAGQNISFSMLYRLFAFFFSALLQKQPRLQICIFFVAQLRVLVHGPIQFSKITSMLHVMPIQPIFEMREAHTDVGFTPAGSLLLLKAHARITKHGLAEPVGWVDAYGCA